MKIFKVIKKLVVNILALIYCLGLLPIVAVIYLIQRVRKPYAAGTKVSADGKGKEKYVHFTFLNVRFYVAVSYGDKFRMYIDVDASQDEKQAVAK